MTNSILLSWERLQPATLFEGLGPLLTSWQPAVTGITFLIIVGAHGWQHFQDGAKGREVLREWYLTLLTLAFVLASPVFLRVAIELGESLQEALPEPSPETVIRRFSRLATAFPEVESILRSGAPTEVDSSRTLLGFADGLWYDEGFGNEDTDPWLEDLGHRDPAREAATDAATQLQSQNIMATYLATNVSMSAAACFAWFMDTVRYLGIHLLALVVPPAIACLRTRVLRVQGLRVLLLMVSLLLWPALWAVGHLGTEGLFDAYANRYERLEISPSKGAFSWGRIDASFDSEDQPQAGGVIVEMGVDVPPSWLLSVALNAVGLALWIGFVTIALPVAFSAIISKQTTCDLIGVRSMY